MARLQAYIPFHIYHLVSFHRKHGKHNCLICIANNNNSINNVLVTIQISTHSICSARIREHETSRLSTAWSAFCGRSHTAFDINKHETAHTERISEITCRKPQVELGPKNKNFARLNWLLTHLLVINPAGAMNSECGHYYPKVQLRRA